MSAIIETIECYPRPIDMFGVVLPASPPDHARCPGGQHIPGVLGGWDCPCPCHHEPRVGS